MEHYFSELSKTNWAQALSKDYFCDKQLEVITVSDGIIMPPDRKEAFLPEGPIFGWGGVTQANGEYVDLSSQKAKNMRNRIEGRINMGGDTSKLKTVQESVIYMNFFIQQWGHYLIDVIGRLWYAMWHDTTTKIVYTCYQEQEAEISGSYLDLLVLMGVDKDRLICVNCPTKFKKVIVPEMSICPGLYYTKEYKKMFDFVVSQCMKDKQYAQSDKIYCSRAMLPQGEKEIGETQIEQVFIENGYTAKYMEKMTLREQILTLNSATEVAMVNGSLAHNLLFMRTDKPVVIINKTYRINLHQLLINQLSGVNAIFVDAYIAPMPILYGPGPFIMKKTRMFINFLADWGFKTDYQCTEKLSVNEKIWYYRRWCYTYRKNILTGTKIREGEFDISDISYRNIRKSYRRSQSLAKKYSIASDH